MFVLAPVQFNGASTAPNGAGPILNGGYRGPEGAGLADDIQPSRNPVAMMGDYKPLFDRWPCESGNSVSAAAPSGSSEVSVTKIILASIAGLVVGAMFKDMNGGKSVV